LLDESYSWAIPKSVVQGFEATKGGNSYRANIELKKFLAQRWANGSFSDRVSLAQWVVKDWGGINRGRPETIENFVRQIERNELRFVFNRVASYSKILPCASIDDYVIYDQRVAVALNAIQVLKGVKDGVAFHMPPGRNKKVGYQGKKEGFSAQPQFKPRALVNDRGWTGIKRDETYNAYLKTIRSVRHALNEVPIYDIEMVLFSNAEDLAVAAMT